MERMDTVGSSSDTHLFFGCRSNEERLYRNMLDEWKANKVLTDVHLALSRDPKTPKRYVQNLIQEQGSLVCELLLRENCRYYVCGDAKMADSCYKACVNALCEHGNISRAKALTHLELMRVQDRWQCDLYSQSSDIDERSYSNDKVAKKLNSTLALTWLTNMKTKSSENKEEWW